MSVFNKDGSLKKGKWSKDEMKEYSAWVKENKEDFNKVGL